MHIIACACTHCKTSWPNTKTTGTWGLTLMELCKARSGRFWRDAEIFDESFDFLDGKHINSQHHYRPYIMIRLLKFSPPCRDNLQGCISLKEIKHGLLMFFLLIFIFFKKMYSQNDEIGVLEVLEIKIFFASQPCWEDLYRIFWKLSPWILKFSGRISMSLLKIKRVKKP